MHGRHAHPRPIRLAVWFKKGGVGKSTNATLLALLAQSTRRQVLLIDLDPASATSRDFLGRGIGAIPENLSTYLKNDLPAPPPVIASGLDNLDLFVSNPQADNLFRHFPEYSTKLRDGLALLPPVYDWVIMDVPHAYDNIAHLGLLAADYLLLPVELSLDCLDRMDMVLAMIEDVRVHNPKLKVLGAVALAQKFTSRTPQKISAAERFVFGEYARQFAEAQIPMFRTIMFRSTTSVADARANADLRSLHWRAKQRFARLMAEIRTRIARSQKLSSPLSHGTQSRRSTRRTTTSSIA